MNLAIPSGRTTAQQIGRLASSGLVAATVLAGLAPRQAIATSTTVPCERLLVVPGPEPRVPFNGPRAIAFDAHRGEIWIADTGNHRIDVFDLNGRRRLEVIHRVRRADGTEVDGMPNAIALTPDGHALVCDALASYLDVLDFRGRSVKHIAPAAGGADSLLGGPGALAISPAGEVLLASRGPGASVERFAPNFTSKGAWGVTGTGRGQLSGITSLAFLRDGNLVVCCAKTEQAVQIFTPAGEYVRGWGRHDIGEGNFSLPSGVGVTGDGRIWVSDQIRKVVQVFDATGVLVGLVSGGATPVEFLYPSALATDGDRLVAVAEGVGNRFQVVRAR